MSELINNAFTGVNIIPTVLLMLVLIYWLTVILGIIDIDFFDFDIDFDIAIIAAGAYGYPLAAEIKNMGKQSIELCSGIYPVFGIKVKTQLIIRKISSMYNDNWIFPIETPPKNYMNIEKGAYWE